MLRQSRKLLVAKARELAKTDFFTAFNMVHNPQLVSTNVGIVGVKIDDQKKNKRK